MESIYDNQITKGNFMKKLILLAAMTMSYQTFAFTSVTLNKEVKLTQNARLKYLQVAIREGSDTYCQVDFTSQENVDSLVIPKGSVFEITSLDQNACARDWGKQCRLDFSARNQELNINLSVLCKDRGFFANNFSEAKVGKVLKGAITVK